MTPETPSSAGLTNGQADEYKMLVTRWDAWDSRALLMKGWVSAGMFASLPSLVQAGRVELFLGACLLSLSVMLVEAVWRTMQGNDHDRILLLEQLARCPDPNQASYQIATAAQERSERVLGEMRQRWPWTKRLCGQWRLAAHAAWTARGNFTIWLPYAPYIAVCLVLAVCSLFVRS